MTDPERTMRPMPLVGGIILGLVVCWLWIAVAFILGFSVAYGSDSDVPAALVLVAPAVPIVVGVVLLLRPRTRQVGAGLLMGVSVGFIAGAGLCVSILLPGSF